MFTTLMLAASLLAAPEPQVDSHKGWVVEIRGYIYHRQAKEEGWIIELQFPQTKPQLEPVEAQYHDDLSAFFRQLEMHKHIDAVEAFYVDDLPAFFKQLKKS